MTCRHSANDPSCGRNQVHQPVAQPDNSRFELLDIIQQGMALVIKVKYESCPNCSFEGVKILVYYGVSLIDVARWRVIDPHFTDKQPTLRSHAPSPIARFPATEEGLRLALKVALDVRSD